MTIYDPGEARSALVDYLRRQMIGPERGDDETLHDDPLWRYATAILYPQEPRSSAAIVQDQPVVEEEAEDAGPAANTTAADDDQPEDPGVGFIHQVKPASAGISFFLSGSPALEVTLSAAVYAKPEQAHPEEVETPLDGAAREEAETLLNDAAGEEAETLLNDPAGETAAAEPPAGYKRRPLGPQTLSLTPPAGNTMRERVLEGAELHVIWRPQSKGWLVTVTLINANHREEHQPRDTEKCLFQVEMSCAPQDGGAITVYPYISLISDNLEDQILNVLYRHETPYAVGHGCAANWDRPDAGRTNRVWLEFMPSHKVPDLTFDLEGVDPRVLSVSGHGNDAYDEAYFERLQDFLAGYRRWIDSLKAANADIPPAWSGAVTELLKRLNESANRIESGILTLQHQPEVAECFQIANRAMLLQRQFKNPALKDFSWRPFQLAFLLMTLPSVAFGDDQYRATVDLIWFPTGGGKTEAYLAMTAFLIFWRRLNHGGEGEGTAVLMRYTLRLLTIQQFQRAAALICACEMLRQTDESQRFGQSAISIGLWVGQSATPNTCQQAHDAVEKLLQSDPPENELFPLPACPCCGTSIVPPRQAQRADYGLTATPKHFTFHCPSPDCAFRTGLPVQVVDEMLYQEPPSLLVATVDKFARLPWEERAGQFFGGATGRPPELIIQDEMHLISGPLGTLVGLYETAIEGLIEWDGAVSPKIIASTATIRRADEQSHALFNREVALFPPSGLDASDSYFARYDTSKPGRFYLGVMPGGQSSQQTQIILTAALLQAPLELDLREQAKDAFWTLVTYHNTLRETGRTLSFIRDEIPERQSQMAALPHLLRNVGQEQVIELTSRGAHNLGQALERLERTADDDEVVSFVACTNMLSVGVDIQRLGLMIMLGQPKTASEYIQATSRVGRGVPGLIVTSYFAARPRDRSHFEQFHSFHAALYRYVEPTSVTPFSSPARERALHAVLTTLIRHQPSTPMAEAASASRFRSDDSEAQKARRMILERIEKVDPNELAASEVELDTRMAEWAQSAQEPHRLVYSSPHRQKAALLVAYEAQKPHEHGTNWRTLNSLRNVDRSSLLWIVNDWQIRGDGDGDDEE